MRSFLFPVLFWLAVLFAIGSSMQYWLSSQEDKCQRYCASAGKESRYQPPRARKGVRFPGRGYSRPDDCECRGAAG